MKNSNLKIGSEIFVSDTKPQMQTLRIKQEVYENIALLLGLERNEKDGKMQRGSSDAIGKFFGTVTEKLKKDGKVDLSVIQEATPATQTEAKPQADTSKASTKDASKSKA